MSFSPVPVSQLKAWLLNFPLTPLNRLQLRWCRTRKLMALFYQKGRRCSLRGGRIMKGRFWMAFSLAAFNTWSCLDSPWCGLFVCLSLRFSRRPTSSGWPKVTSPSLHTASEIFQQHRTQWCAAFGRPRWEDLCKQGIIAPLVAF